MNAPVSVVWTYYDLLSRGEFEQAYRLLSTGAQERQSPSGFLVAWLTQQSLQIVRIAPGEAPDEVSIDVLVTGNDLVARQVMGVWQVVQEEDAWRLSVEQTEQQTLDPRERGWIARLRPSRLHGRRVIHQDVEPISGYAGALVADVVVDGVADLLD